MAEAASRSRERYRTSESTRAKIIVAAQRLIAEFGIARVSYREIATSAGQANSNAVQYHFGDRQALVRAVFEHYSREFEPLRKSMLEAVAALGTGGDIRALLEILFLPYLTVVDEAGRHTYAGFVWQYMINPRPEGLPYPLDRPGATVPTLSRVLGAVYERLSFLPDVLVRPRVQIATQAFVGSVLRWDSESPEAKRALPIELAAADAIEQIAGGIVVPPAATLAGVQADSG